MFSKHLNLKKWLSQNKNLIGIQCSYHVIHLYQLHSSMVSLFSVCAITATINLRIVLSHKWASIIQLSQCWTQIFSTDKVTGSSSFSIYFPTLVTLQKRDIVECDIGQLLSLDAQGAFSLQPALLPNLWMSEYILLIYDKIEKRQTNYQVYKENANT